MHSVAVPRPSVEATACAFACPAGGAEGPPGGELRQHQGGAGQGDVHKGTRRSFTGGCVVMLWHCRGREQFEGAARGNPPRARPDVAARACLAFLRTRDQATRALH